MTQLLRWTRRLLGTLAVIVLMAWMWAWGAQWVLRWRAERLLADVKKLEVGKSTEADVKQFLQGRHGWEHYDSRSEEFSYSTSLFVFDPYSWVLGHMGPNGPPDWLTTINSHLGLHPTTVTAYLAVAHGSVTDRDFWVIIQPAADHVVGVRSREILLVGSSPDDPETFPHSVLHWTHGMAPGIEVEYDPQEDLGTRTGMMDFNLSCITRFLSCENEADVLPIARQRMIDEKKKTGAVP